MQPWRCTASRPACPGGPPLQGLPPAPAAGRSCAHKRALEGSMPACVPRLAASSCSLVLQQGACLLSLLPAAPVQSQGAARVCVPCHRRRMQGRQHDRLWRRCWLWRCLPLLRLLLGRLGLLRPPAAQLSSISPPPCCLAGTQVPGGRPHEHPMLQACLQPDTASASTVRRMEDMRRAQQGAAQAWQRQSSSTCWAVQQARAG